MVYYSSHSCAIGRDSFKYEAQTNAAIVMAHKDDRDKRKPGPETKPESMLTATDGEPMSKNRSGGAISRGN